MQETIGMFYPLVEYVLVTVIIVVVLVQLFGTYKAKANIMREEAYRKLSEQATAAEQKAVEEQKKIADALEDMRARLTAIEKMLRDVE
jgi:PHD/YefM family antitoxin component YafN of YafNO toxin-antitoxin module